MFDIKLKKIENSIKVISENWDVFKLHFDQLTYSKIWAFKACTIGFTTFFFCHSLINIPYLFLNCQKIQKSILHDSEIWRQIVLKKVFFAYNS